MDGPQKVEGPLCFPLQGGPYIRFGSKADICNAKSHVRFGPNSDRESGLWQKVRSAFTSKRCVIAYRFKILNASAADGRHSGRLCFSFRRYRPRRARTPDPPWWKHRLKFFTAIPLQRVPSLLTTVHRFLLRLPFWHWVISRENLHRRL
jgi:hypothetical protein